MTDHIEDALRVGRGREIRSITRGGGEPMDEAFLGWALGMRSVDGRWGRGGSRKKEG